MVEAAMAVVLVLGACWVQVELARRVAHMVDQYRSAFQYTRLRGMGVRHESSVRRSHPLLHGDVRFVGNPFREAFVGQVHRRYPSLWRLQGNPSKHHFEVTERCRFPW